MALACPALLAAAAATLRSRPTAAPRRLAPRAVYDYVCTLPLPLTTSVNSAPYATAALVWASRSATALCLYLLKEVASRKSSID